MAISAARSRALCTASELNLVNWSSARHVKSLTPAQLKQKIERARKLRNKYRDLAKKQRGEARGKRKPTGKRAAQGNENTVEKADLFAEVLTRFEDAARSKAATESGTTKTTRKKKTSKKKVAGVGAAKKTRKKSGQKKATGRAASGTKAGSKKTKKKKTSGRTADSKRKKPTEKAASSGETPKVALAGASDQKRSASLAAASGSRGINPLTGSSALEAQAARRTRRKKSAKSARAGGIESRFAATVTDKIQGHISGSNKRRQARRDSRS